jgi:hypothetical protein
VPHEWSRPGSAPPTAVRCPTTPAASACAADRRAARACRTDDTPYPTEAVTAACQHFWRSVPCTPVRCVCSDENSALTCGIGIYLTSLLARRGACARICGRTDQFARPQPSLSPGRRG